VIPSSRRTAMLLVGCVVLGVGVALLLAADLGSDGYSTFVNGLTITTGVDFWIVNLVVGVVLVALAMLRKVHPGIGTVVQVVLVGVTVSVVLGVIATPDELVSRLFDRFAAAGATGGTGLGLYLVREIARGHGGEVVYEPPAEDSPTTFLIRFPVAAAIG